MSPPRDSLPGAVARRLRAFGRDCLANGDMTPGAKRMLDAIADELDDDAALERHLLKRFSGSPNPLF